MNIAIDVKELTKLYRVPVRDAGVKKALKNLFLPQFRTILALDRLSFSIEQGATIGYLGPNGAGKTTTLKILSGLLHPSDGKVRVLGFNPWEHKNAFKRQIGFIMGQKGQLWWDLPAQDSFVLLREIYEIPASQYKSTLTELVERFRVANLLDVPVRNLSLGERMKMELIAVLLHAPSVLFLDEPTIGLDVMAQHEIRTLLKEYQLQRGVTLILASHYMRDVEELCDRVLLIDKGNLLFDGTIDALKKHYSSHKEVAFTFFKPAERPSLISGGEVHHWDENQATLSVEHDHVSQVIQTMVNQYPVLDVAIQEPTLEDVIHTAFSSIAAREDA